MFGKESLETSAYFNRSNTNCDAFAKRAPTYLGRLLALTLIAFVTSEEYHTKSSPANTLTEPKHTQELGLAPFVTLSLAAIANYSDQISEMRQLESSPTPTQVQQTARQQLETNPATGDLSPITGYYCDQIPGYPVGDGGGYCGPTASGELPGPGIAACGEKWPLGTKLKVEGFGEVVCLDRGRLAQNQVDIFFPTNKDLAESGKPDWAEITEVE